METDKVFGFVKPLVDVHTMGLYTMANLVRECGYKAVIAPPEVNYALEHVQKLNNYGLVKSWIANNNITHLCFSYRLDPNDACDYFMQLYEMLLGDNMTSATRGTIQAFSFAGLPEACRLIAEKSQGNIILFPGSETPMESLERYNIPQEKIRKSLIADSEYDNMRMAFAKNIIESESYKSITPQDHYGYSTCGTDNDTYIDRLNYAKEKGTLPIIRTHSGPYNPDRLEAIKEYNSWVEDLAKSKLLDVLSIGSSQLTQSNHG